MKTHSQRTARHRGRLAPGMRGFTLIELVMVIVLLGVLAVFAVPRILDMQTFNSRGLHDGTVALLRYAQKTAIAQRRTVCVTFTGNSATLTMAANASTPGCSPVTALTGPSGETPAAVVGRGTAAYTATPAVLNFNGLGQPVNAAGAALATETITVANGPGNITVQAVTGFVQ